MDFQFIIDNAKNIVTHKYFCFEGRADRKEFWCWVLVVLVINLILCLIPTVVGKYLDALFSLFVFLPGLGVSVRRLHDTGKSGWLLLIGLIPVIGSLILLCLFILRGDTESNKYGEPAVR